MFFHTNVTALNLQGIYFCQKRLTPKDSTLILIISDPQISVHNSAFILSRLSMEPCVCNAIFLATVGPLQIKCLEFRLFSIFFTFTATDLNVNAQGDVDKLGLVGVDREDFSASLD